MEIHMVENRQKGITNAYRNDKKDVDATPPPKNVGRLIYEYVDRLRYIR